MNKIMKYSIALIIGLLSGLFIKDAEASECRTYTPEQMSALALAYSVGKPYDLSYTLMAITERESFVGNHIIRVNSRDGKYGTSGS